jgi:hypothetical protein
VLDDLQISIAWNHVIETIALSKQVEKMTEYFESWEIQNRGLLFFLAV